MKMVRKSAGLNVCRFFCFGDKCVFLLIFIFFRLFKLKVFTKILVGTIMLLVTNTKELYERRGRKNEKKVQTTACTVSIGRNAGNTVSICQYNNNGRYWYRNK